MTEAARSLSDWFAQLLPLSEAERNAILDTLSPKLAQSLRALLLADAGADDCIDQALAVDAIASVHEAHAGQRIGPWRVLRELGSGGMGTVLLAERDAVDFAQQVAIKIIRGFPSTDGMRRLRQERQILANLDHPGIARLLDGGETESGQPYLVVEYVPGLTLDAHLESHALSRDQRIDLLIQIGAAVQHAHQHLVIHRDIKPANVMVRDDGQIKLLDFGVAKLVDLGSDNDAIVSTRVFTPGYASPEQRAGQAIGIATDIYSLGMLLRTLLIAGEGAKQPLNAELSGIVGKACADVPAHRYITVAAFCDDLERYRRGLPITAAADTRWYRARKFIARHPFASAASVFAVTIIAVLIGYLLAALNDARHERALAVAAQQQALENLQRAKSVIEFFAEMFMGVAPEHALGRKLAPSDLLDRAEKLLRDHPPADAGLRADLSAMIGNLYQSLGDGEQAARLLKQSLHEQSADSVDAALEIAMRHLNLSRALFSIDQPETAMQEVDTAIALRKQFAGDRVDLQLDSALQRAQGLLLTRNLPEAELAMAEAGERAQQQSLSPAQELELEDTRAWIGNERARWPESVRATQAGLRLIEQHAELPRTRIIQLERNQARALMGQGALVEAEAAYQRAIRAQEQWVGVSGAQAASLYSDHAILLATMGRYELAAQGYLRAAQIQFEAGGPKAELSPLLQNNLCDLETARGLYADALAHCEAALRLHADSEADNPDRMIVQSNLARVQTLRGQAQEGLNTLLMLRDSSIRFYGEGSFPVALHSTRAVRAALLAGDAVQARKLADESVLILDTLYTSPHPWRARALRFRALVALHDSRWKDAAADLKTALEFARSALPDDHPLIAQIRLDQATIDYRTGHEIEARRQLDLALPSLRSCCTAQEIDRAQAELLDAALPPAR